MQAFGRNTLSKPHSEPEYEEDSVEANQRADRLEFIREFQEMMEQAFEKLLSKPARRHPC